MKGNDKRKIKLKDKRKFNLGNKKNNGIKSKKVSKKRKYKTNSKSINNNKSKNSNKKIRKTKNSKTKLFFIFGILFIFLVGGFVVKENIDSNEVDNNGVYSGFTGMKYLEELGVYNSIKVDTIEDVDEAKLVELDGVCVATTYIDGEWMYRFQVEKNGEKSYDMEISNLMSSIHFINDYEEPKVKVSKYVYENEENKQVKINHYDIYVQESKMKVLLD